MKLRQVYNEFIRIYLKKKDNKVIDMDIEDGKYDWITDGVSIWAIPKENPFNFKKIKAEWFKKLSEEGLPVTKITRSPYRDAKDIIKLEAEKEKVSMYLDEKKLKWFDKNYGIRISKEPLGRFGLMCQVYEDGELRGLILGVDVADSRKF